MTPPADRRQTARQGEAAARRFLEARGYRILASNFHAPGGELDLVAQRGAVLCFVEVKCRSADTEFAPQVGVTPEKQRRLARAAQHYLARFDPAPPTRFDVIEVVLRPGGGVQTIRHHAGAFAQDTR